MYPGISHGGVLDGEDAGSASGSDECRLPSGGRNSPERRYGGWEPPRHPRAGLWPSAIRISAQTLGSGVAIFDSDKYSAGVLVEDFGGWFAGGGMVLRGVAGASGASGVRDGGGRGR